MKCKVTTFDALKRRVMALTLGFWLLLMVLITLGGAQDVYNQLEPQVQQYLLTYAQSPVNYSEENAALPGYQQYWWAFNVGQAKHEFDLKLSFPFAVPRFSGGLIPDNLDLGYEVAMIYWNDDGDEVKSESLLFFSYMTQESWADEKHIDGYAVIDLTAFPEGEIVGKEIGTGPYDGRMAYPFYTKRLKGYFEGDVFQPVAFSIKYEDAHVSGDWETVFNREVRTDEKLVCIYSQHLSGVRFEENPVTADGIRYDSLTDLLDSWRQGKSWASAIIGATDSVVMMRQRFEDSTGEWVDVALALRCNPLLFSVTALWPVYVVTLLLALMACYLLLKNVKRELTQPLEQLSMKLSGLSVLIPDSVDYDSRWQEPYDLERKALSLQQALQDAKAENRQLQTQLEYARNAEEYRRRMISGLTHELKTPLAVIHSYAEGLQEGIAEEKKEQYLGVILEESEKMDAMVLQMLDLSRLEAGKVKLANDHFALAALTRGVFEKMQPLAAEKGLTVRFTMPNECRLTADEGRITQVVTNLASNAIKYTPEGGEISVIVYRKNDKNILCVENTCPRLSPEALSKVFDSFYRGDAARTTEGTGLGLAIVKAIVEQHGGSCQVFNTPTGVQFQVILP